MSETDKGKVLLPPSISSVANLEGVDVEVLEGCRAVTGMSTLDFVAGLGLARRAIPKVGGGMRMGVRPGGTGPEIMVYGMVVEVVGVDKGGGTPRKRVLLGLRRDFEKLGAAYGRGCDRLDRISDRFVTG